jgi:hypothetical protein
MSPITLTIPRPQPQLSTTKVPPLQRILLAAALTHVRMKKQTALKAIEASQKDQSITQEQSFEMAQILLLVSVSLQLATT